MCLLSAVLIVGRIDRHARPRLPIEMRVCPYKTRLRGFNPAQPTQVGFVTYSLGLETRALVAGSDGILRAQVRLTVSRLLPGEPACARLLFR